MKEIIKKYFLMYCHWNTKCSCYEMEMVNFSHYKDVKEKNVIGGGNGTNFSYIQGRLKHYFKCNSAKHFACDYTGLRNDINNKLIHCFKCNSAFHKIKPYFFQAAVVLILLYGCTTWMLT